MKTKKLITVLTLGISVMFTSCKKDDATPADSTEIETTFALSADQAVADNLTEDANDVMMQVAEEKDLTGNFTGAPIEISNFLCATVTVTPQNGFPKTVVIDFGTGCTSPYGIHRRGIIQVVISDSLRKSGSTAVMTFDNYYVNTFKKEGTINWTNTSTTVTKSWRREVVNGKVTALNGRFWLHTGIKEVVQTQGVTTPHNPLDDIFSITGNSTVTNANGKSRSATILEPLQKKIICKNIDRGRIRFEGPNHFAVLDFGNGVCDDVAVISIDGYTPHTIQLP